MIRAPRTAHASLGAQEHYLGLPAAVRLGHLVGEVRLLKTSGTHALVSGGVRAWGRVRGIEACLDQRLPRLAGDHGLQLPCGKRVHMARLASHQQQDLSASQCGELVGLPAGQGKNRESQVTGTTHSRTRVLACPPRSQLFFSAHQLQLPATPEELWPLKPTQDWLHTGQAAPCCVPVPFSTPLGDVPAKRPWVEWSPQHSSLRTWGQGIASILEIPLASLDMSGCFPHLISQ